MATGNYGTVRPADVSVNDVEMWFHKTASRDDTTDTVLEPLDPSQVLKKVDHPDNPGERYLYNRYTTKTN
jgi:hypothetical protein